MTPQTVNAYYNPTTNEICFPAGILQYPFFDMNADDAFNYGAIGVVIGHEMTHGFDDQGRQFDKDGNLKDWWTAEDAKRFEERAQVMVNFFDSIQVLPGLNANGSLTLGENIADHGGLQVSFQAFKNATKDAPLPVEDGFTPEQRFFLSYAGVWAGNIRDEQIRLQTKSDPHSLGRWRVNGALPQIGAWYDAFGITRGIRCIWLLKNVSLFGKYLVSAIKSLEFPNLIESSGNCLTMNLAFTMLSFWNLHDKHLFLCPMKRRRYIAWVLMLVSIIMLTASVLPHHHHREILCLQHDMTLCGCQCSVQHQQHNSSDENHTCNAGCVTKFKSVTPDRAQNSVSPDYSFCSLLYTVTDVLALSLHLTEHNTLPYNYYLEKLHSTCLPHVKGLRAPPCDVLA